MLRGIQLRYYTNEEIRNLAVVKVTHASTYDRGVPKLDGVTDPRLGLVDHTIRCPTCNKGSCDQHLGYIELARPVYRLGTINLVLMMLRSVCRQCAEPKFRVRDNDPDECINLSELVLSMRPGKERLRAISEACRSRFVCPHCKISQPNYVRRDRTFLDATYRPKDLLKESPEFQAFAKERFMPDEALAILENIPEVAWSWLGFTSTQPSELMLTLQIVPPPSIRPSNFVGDSKVRSENDLTVALQDIVRANVDLQELWNALPHDVQSGQRGLCESTSKTTWTEVYTSWDKLQIMTSGLVNHTIKKTVATRMGLLAVVNSTNKRKVIDMKTRLTGKKGRLRGNLSGKRVDQSGRTVISPDSSHDIFELGVPDCIMNKLTFPESVTSWNVAALAQCVVRGSFTAHGALAVRPPGSDAEHVIWLPVLDREARIDLASQLSPGYVVERHLQDGDYVLFNRQPSLWKASMMAFQCYRVSGLTCKLPLPVTRPFNADFDGDEMNIHALQTYTAMAEAHEIMATPHQIVSPQSNAVLIGLVQDSLVGGFLMTSQNTLFTEDEFMQMMCHVRHNPKDIDAYSAMSMPSKQINMTTGLWQSNMPEPAILKPRRMYTGKQVMSLLMPSNITFTKAVRNATAHHVADIFADNVVIVRQGLHLAGRLCKASLGTSTGGFVQSIWKLHGPWAAAKFVSDAQRILVKHLTHDTVCISIRDTVQSDLTYKAVDTIIQEQYVKASNLLFLQVPPEIQEVRGSSMLQETLRRVGGRVIESMDTESGLSIVVNSGSKGNLMNIAQIAGCVGQQTVYGRRVTIRKTPMGSRTLATFSPNDMRPASRGFISSSYLRGLSPTEFFYHQMAGREGIVATAVSTADTGYNQRRMVKGQESQCVMYDGSVRVGNNSIVQFIYGGDDMDGSKLVRKSFEFMKGNLSPKLESLVWKPYVDGLRKQVASAIHARALHLRTTDFMFSVPWTYSATTSLHRDLQAESFKVSHFLQLERLLVDCHQKLHSLKKPMTRRPLVTALVLAEVLWNLPNLVPQDVSTIVQTYASSMIQPGEGVGAVGSSSIGEPSMQLTLNVFHFSGIASKNVTISGLPRFKELINAADTSTTANMTVSLSASHDAQTVLSKTQYVYLRSVVEPSVERTMHWPSFVQDLVAEMIQSSSHASTSVGGSKKRTRDIVDNIAGRSTWGLKLQLKWFGCKVMRTHMKTIVASLRAEYPDWTIVADPHGYRFDANKGPYIYMCQEAKSSDHLCKTTVERLQELLMKDHAIQGLWNVKRAISMEEPFTQAQTIFDTTKETSRMRTVIDTEGSSLSEMAKVPGIKIQTLRTTNVMELASFFGITTAVAVLQAELHKTISFDSAYIDMRHTWLLADSMCRTGKVCAMNRHNMEDLGASLLQRASFEQSIDVFEEGASFGKVDSLSGATERIMVGQPVAIGTGLVHTLASEDFHETSWKPRNAGVVVKAFEQPNTDGRKKHARQAHEPIFIGSNYETRFQEYDRVCEDSFLLQAMSQLRNTAALERFVPDLWLELVLDWHTFDVLRKEAKQYTRWTSHEGLTQTLTVRYDDLKYDESKDCTIRPETHHLLETTVLQARGTSSMDSMSHLTKQHRRVFFYKTMTDEHRTVTLRKNFLVGLQDVPHSTTVIEAFIDQHERFSKNGLHLDIFRRFKGSDAADLDEHMSTKEPIYMVRLSFESTEALLQERVTDAQIANGLLDKLPSVA